MLEVPTTSIGEKAYNTMPGTGHKRTMGNIDANA